MRCIVCKKKLNLKELKGYNNSDKICKEESTARKGYFYAPPLPFCTPCYQSDINIQEILNERAKCDCCGKELNFKNLKLREEFMKSLTSNHIRPAFLCSTCKKKDVKGGGFLYPINEDTRRYEEEIKFIQKVLSLGFQGKHKEADKLCKKLPKSYFKLFKNKEDEKIYNKILSLTRKNKFEDAKKLIKKLKTKGYEIKIPERKEGIMLRGFGILFS